MPRGKSLLLVILLSMLKGIPLNNFAVLTFRKHPSIMKRVVLSLLFFGFVQSVFADNLAPPATKLVKPGKLIATEKFDQEDSVGTQKKRGTTGWATVLGDWKIVDGAAYGISEPPSEKRPKGHAAGCDQLVDLDDFVISGEFKLGDAHQVGVITRDANQPPLHLGRVLITKKSIWIQKMTGISKQTRSEVLTKIDVPIDTNTWHKFVIEVQGRQFFARIDDHVLEAKHPRFADRKGRIGFIAAGEGAQFRNVSLWEAAKK
jgi:hypothetical protein